MLGPVKALVVKLSTFVLVPLVDGRVRWSSEILQYDGSVLLPAEEAGTVSKPAWRSSRDLTDTGGRDVAPSLRVVARKTSTYG